MIEAFSAANQLRRRPAPVNTSIRRPGSGNAYALKSTCAGAVIRSDNHLSAARARGAPQTPLTEV
jgi:hypothetical protein